MVHGVRNGSIPGIKPSKMLIVKEKENWVFSVLMMSSDVKVLAKNKPAGINKHFSMAIAMEELVSMLGDESKVAWRISPRVTS